MKKIAIPALALLLLLNSANAQDSAKKPVKNQVLLRLAHLQQYNKSLIRTWRGEGKVQDENQYGAENGFMRSTSDVQFCQDNVRNFCKWSWQYVERSSDKNSKSEETLLLFDRMQREGLHYEAVYLSSSVKKHFQVRSIYELRKYKMTEYFEPMWFFSHNGESMDQILSDLALKDLDEIGWAVIREDDLVKLRRINDSERETEMVFDLSQRGLLTLVTNHRKDAEMRMEIEYHEIDGVWLPLNWQSRTVAYKSNGKIAKDFSRKVRFTKSVLNEEVDEAEFTLAAIGAKRGDVIDDTRVHALFPYCKQFDELHWINRDPLMRKTGSLK